MCNFPTSNAPTKECLLYPWVGWKKVISLIAQGLISRAKAQLNHSNKGHNKKIQQFFLQARSNEAEYGVTDFSSVRYRILLNGVEKYVPFLEARTGNVLDLGCGGLTFLNYLRLHHLGPSSYHGVDLVVRSADREAAAAQTVTLEQADIAKASFTMSPDVNLIVAINSLIYLEDIAPLVRRLSLPISNEMYLIIVEPIESLLWESFFDGIHLTFRDPQSLIGRFTEAGWSEVHRRDLYMLAFGGVFIGRLSYAVVLRKSAYA